MTVSGGLKRGAFKNPGGIGGNAVLPPHPVLVRCHDCHYGGQYGCHGEDHG
jgi:hypothetical protein